MKFLFTGASSFTGYWFVSELARQGHDVVAVFQRQAADYSDDIRRTRVDRLRDRCRAVYGLSLGDAGFRRLIHDERPLDVYCHHAAQVGDYKRADFKVVDALANNTCNLADVVDALDTAGCSRVLLTGSFFEDREGAGSAGSGAVSPYGLSKTLTAEVFRFYLERAGMQFGKFVIPNPFGPYEERRFTYYLMKQWFAERPAAVKTPDYVRDNIHVSLLAKAYAAFATRLPADPGYSRTSPSGYVETQGVFASRFAGEMRRRTGLPCELVLERQTEFLEPRVRINTDSPHLGALDWDEAGAWDEIAEYYTRFLPLDS